MDWSLFHQVLSTHAIGWTLVHSVWLGAAAWVLHVVLQVTLRRWDPRVRYAAACACLLLLVSSLVLTWALASVIPKSAQPALWHSAVSAPTGFDNSGLISRPAVPTVKPWLRWLSQVDQYLPWLVLTWAVGIVLYLLGSAGAVAILHQRAARALPIDCERTLEAFAQLCARLLPGRLVTLRQTGFVRVPSTFGWLRPVVLLPIGMLGNLPLHEIECIIAHELAHIRRRDYLINILQSVLETALFFHPLVRRINRQIRELREECCDDLAIEALGGRRKEYAGALVAFEKLRSSPAFALAVSGGSVVDRLQRLVDGQRRSARRGYGHLLGTLAVVGLSGSVAMGYVRGRIEEQATFAYAESHTTGQVLYRYLRLDRDNPDLIAAVSLATQRTRNKRQLTPAELDELSYVLIRGGRANALHQASAQHYGPASRRDPIPGSTWDGGQGWQWHRIAEQLLKQSRRAESVEQRQRLSRAAMLLAAQDSFHGLGLLPVIVRVPDFQELTGYPPATLARIRQIVVAAEKDVGEVAAVRFEWQRNPDKPIPPDLLRLASLHPDLAFYLVEFMGQFGPSHPHYAEARAVIDRLPYRFGFETRKVPPWYFVDKIELAPGQAAKGSPLLPKYNDVTLPPITTVRPPVVRPANEASDPTTRPTARSE